MRMPKGFHESYSIFGSETYKCDRCGAEWLQTDRDALKYMKRHWKVEHS